MASTSVIYIGVQWSEPGIKSVFSVDIGQGSLISSRMCFYFVGSIFGNQWLISRTQGTFYQLCRQEPKIRTELFVFGVTSDLSTVIASCMFVVVQNMPVTVTGVVILHLVLSILRV